MIAVDTNVIVRIVTHDDPDQARRAVALFERERIFITKTVLLEVEWVLRFSYRLPRAVIVSTLRKVVGLGTVEVEDPNEVSMALDWHERGRLLRSGDQAARRLGWRARRGLREMCASAWQWQARSREDTVTQNC